MTGSFTRQKPIYCELKYLQRNYYALSPVQLNKSYNDALFIRCAILDCFVRLKEHMELEEQIWYLN